MRRKYYLLDMAWVLGYVAYTHYISLTHNSLTAHSLTTHASAVLSQVSLVVAGSRPDLIKGIVGISADPDFTENLLWRELSAEVSE